MIGASRAVRSSGVMPVTVARVPTAMNTGVSTGPRAVSRRPRRARRRALGWADGVRAEEGAPVVERRRIDATGAGPRRIHAAAQRIVGPDEKAAGAVGLAPQIHEPMRGAGVEPEAEIERMIDA